MRRFLRPTLRLLGVALVIFVLTRIQVRDELVWPDGTVQTGTVSASTEATLRFEVAETGEIIETTQGELSSPRIERGVLTIIQNAEQGLLLLAVLLFGPITLISISRWWLLLRAIGLPVSFPEALRLSYIGFFFNAVVPGLTGGDVVKAFYVARGSPAPYKSFLSVFVDRGIGMFGLALVSAAVVTISVGEPGFLQVALLIYGALFFGTVTGALLFSRRLRRLLHVEALIAKLPFNTIVQEIDQAVTVYRRAPGSVAIAVLLSMVNHVGIVLMTFMIGRGLGIANPLSHFLIIVPVCLIIASIPLVPGGWGMREGAFAYFFALVGVAPQLSVPTSILLALGQLAWFMVGGLVFIARPDRVSANELQKLSAEMQASTAIEPPLAS